MTTTKTCTKCGTVKPLTEFYKSAGARLSTCKSCYDNAAHTAHDRSSPPTWTPLKPSDLPQPVLRPGALDHEKYGNRLPDGSIQPYRKPRCEPCYRQPQALQPRYSNN